MGWLDTAFARAPFTAIASIACLGVLLAVGVLAGTPSTATAGDTCPGASACPGTPPNTGGVSPGPITALAPEAEVRDGLADGARLDGPDQPEAGPTALHGPDRTMEDLQALPEPSPAEERPLLPGPADPLETPPPREADRSLPVSFPDSVPMASPAPADGEDGHRGEHEPIAIAGDVGPTGFILGQDPLTGEPIYRPGSGVVDGEGTPEDPYLIEGWRVPSVSILATTAHVRMEDLAIHGAPTARDLVALEAAENVHIRSVTASPSGAAPVLGTPHGVDVSGSSNVLVEDSRIQALTDDGIYISDSSNVTIQGNAITDNRNGGVWISSVDGAHVEGNLLKGNTWGIDLRGTDVTVEGNRIAANDVGFFIGDGLGHIIRDNAFIRNHNSLPFWGGTAPLVEDNLLWLNSGDGIEIARIGHVGSTDGDRPVVRNNTIAGPTGDGILVGSAPGTLVEGNELVGSGGQSIYLRGADARETTVRDNLVASEPRRGIDVAGAHEATVVDNVVEDAWSSGIELHWGVDGVQLEGNTIEGDPWHGINLNANLNTTVRANDLTAGLGARGDLGAADELVIEDNTVDGDRLVYERNPASPELPADAGQVILVNATDLAIADRDLDPMRVSLWASENVTVRNTTFPAGSSLRIVDARGATIEDASFERSRLSLTGSGELTVAGNHLDATPFRGSPDDEMRFVDNTVQNTTTAVRVSQANLTFVGNELADNERAARLTAQPASTIDANDVAGNGEGIDLFASEGAQIRDNMFRSNHGPGLIVRGGQGAVVANNTFLENGLRVERSPYQDADPDIHSSNTVNGDPLRYVADEAEATVEAPAGQVIMLNATDAHVEDVHVHDLRYGITVHGSANVTIEDAQLDANRAGILAERSPGLTLTGSATDRNAIAGLALVSSPGAHLADNAFTGDGVVLAAAGSGTPAWGHDIDRSNTVNGDPIVYTEQPGELAPDEPIGQLLARNQSTVELDGSAFEGVSAGPHLASVGTVEIEDTSVDAAWTGLRIREASEVRVRSSALNATTVGALLHGDRLTVQDSDLSADRIPIDVRTGGQARVVGNVIASSGYHGVSLAGSTAEGTTARIEGNRIDGEDWTTAIRVGIDGARVTGNTVVDGRTGIWIRGASDVQVDNNTISQTATGLQHRWGSGLTVEHNAFEDNDIGYRTDVLQGPQTIHENTFIGNDVGLVSPDPYDARFNYWGCAEGPLEPGCDPVTGPARLDPWLTEAPARAGAGS